MCEVSSVSTASGLHARRVSRPYEPAKRSALVAGERRLWLVPSPQA